jgi:epoxyqueuosine reductase
VTPEALAERVKATGRRLGFDLVAVGTADPPEHRAHFEAWLDGGYAGAMAYLERGREKRLDPCQVLPGACLWWPVRSLHQGRRPPGRPKVPATLGGLPHGLEPRLRAILIDLAAAAPGTTGRAYVDTGPVLERDLAARAGLGWVGKNTMLLHPALGSFFFIGVVLTTAELATDAPLPDRCGTCTRCLDACPTEAFPRPRVLDARRCVSYLTIEHRGPITAELRPGVGALAFGCDVCQDVCPWNRRAPVTGEAAFQDRGLPALTELIGPGDEAWAAREARSRRGGGGQPGARRWRSAAVVSRRRVALVGPGRREPLVQLYPPERSVSGLPEALAALAAADAREVDPEVRAEIDAARRWSGEGRGSPRASTRAAMR